MIVRFVFLKMCHTQAKSSHRNDCTYISQCTFYHNESRSFSTKLTIFKKKQNEKHDNFILCRPKHQCSKKISGRTKKNQFWQKWYLMTQSKKYKYHRPIHDYSTKNSFIKYQAIVRIIQNTMIHFQQSNEPQRKFGNFNKRHTMSQCWNRPLSPGMTQILVVWTSIAQVTR